MKTERRHELKTNELADWLGRNVQASQPYLRLIVGGALVVALLLVGGIYYVNNQAIRQGDAWQEFYAATENPNREESLRDVAQRYGDTEVGQWARNMLADIELTNGSRHMFEDRSKANELLASAEQDYQIVAESANDPYLKRRALMGLAQSLEAVNRIERAKIQYAEIKNNWPDSYIGKSAAQSLKRVENQGDFYDWFFDQQPSPSAALTGGMNFGEDLPSTPDNTGGFLDSPASDEEKPFTATILPSDGDLDLRAEPYGDTSSEVIDESDETD